MGLFDFFKKKTVLTESQKKWNKMWALWAQGQVDSPYAELMTYQNEINNGGHDQYFSNFANTVDLQTEISALETILPSKLKNNLQKAYKAFLISEETEDDEKSEEIIAQCDAVFYENEKEISHLLEEYAAKIKL